MSLDKLLGEYEKYQFAVGYKQGGQEIVDFDYHRKEREEVKALITKAYEAGRKEKRENVAGILANKAIVVRDEVCIPSETYSKLISSITKK